MSGDILLDFAARLLGTPQAPDQPLPRPVEHAFRRGFALPLVVHSYREYETRSSPVKCAPETVQIACERSPGDDGDPPADLSDIMSF